MPCKVSGKCTSYMLLATLIRGDSLDRCHNPNMIFFALIIFAFGVLKISRSWNQKFLFNGVCPKKVLNIWHRLRHAVIITQHLPSPNDLIVKTFIVSIEGLFTWVTALNGFRVVTKFCIGHAVLSHLFRPNFQATVSCGGNDSVRFSTMPARNCFVSK